MVKYCLRWLLLGTLESVPLINILRIGNMKSSNMSIKLCKKGWPLLLAGLAAAILGSLISACSPGLADGGELPKEFNGRRAYQDVLFQTQLGPRNPGSEGHQKIISWMQQELENAGWEVSFQKTAVGDLQVINLIAERQPAGEGFTLGAHYDTRIYADQDPDPARRNQPVPGANDGASGVAVLLELARTLPEDLNVPVRLVFFDAEDNGGIQDREWIMGSRAYVESLDEHPRGVVILDMIGDAELTIYEERNSHPEMVAQIWEEAARLGYHRVFIPEEKYSMLDDHTPFLEKDIPAVLVIDFDYPHWHTVEDTADKVSAESLQIVGDTITAWLKFVPVQGLH